MQNTDDFYIENADYIIHNKGDIKDIEKDKQHPRKKLRPLASGQITKNRAIIIAILLLILSIITNLFITKSIFNLSLYFLLAYIIINISYSFGLKNIAIIDIILLASGFILRVYYGASILNIEVSKWLFLTIMSASLFLGLGKRKKELLTNKNTRNVLKEYNEEFLDKFQYLNLSMMFVFYSLWTLEQKNEYMYLTIPLLIIIFMKYSLIIEKSGEGDPTTILYQNKAFLLLYSICYYYDFIIGGDTILIYMILIKRFMMEILQLTFSYIL